MKKVLALLLSIGLVLSLVACSADEDVVEPDEPFTVALLVPGTVTDGGWSQTAYTGLLAIEEELDAEIKFSENVGSDNAIKVMSDYAIAGADVIIGHGMQYYDSALELKGEYPDIQFMVTSTNQSEGPNLNSLLINNKEMGFISGYMAYALGRDQLIFFEGAPYTSIIITGWGAMAGFEYAHSLDTGTDRVIKNVIVKMENTNDVQAAQSLAETMALSPDWDVEKLAFTSSANDATRGAVNAGQELRIPVIGYYTDKSADSDMILLDVLTNDPTTFVLMIEKAMAGELDGSHYLFGVADGIVYPTDIYSTYAGELPEGLQDTLDQLVADIESGAIDASAITDAWGEENVD